ncbi:DUF6879 family protein [Streptomyces sp. NPDC050516]|uniref:DUF6879 family protein n=1 Tax=Streptomyces sp. NPDC050516 TaxID=3365621 RepID=UPI0037A759A2
MTYPVREALAKARRSAVHLEMRDSYTPDDPEFARWRSGHRYGNDPVRLPDWWGGWRDVVGGATARGVVMRRARIVSEQVTDYIRYEHEAVWERATPHVEYKLA